MREKINEMRELIGAIETSCRDILSGIHFVEIMHKNLPKTNEAEREALARKCYDLLHRFPIALEQLTNNAVIAAKRIQEEFVIPIQDEIISLPSSETN